MAAEGLPLGGQEDPLPRERFMVAGPGIILGMGAFLATTGLITTLASGNVAATPGLILGAAIFDGIFARFLYDFLPRRGRLDGTVLTVEAAFPASVRRCDLASAAVIRLRRTMPLAGHGSVPVLYLRQHAGDPPVRLALRGPGLDPFPAGHLRLLADAISQRPAEDEAAGKIALRLRAQADDQEAPTGIVPDWSFRTSPQHYLGVGERPAGTPAGSSPTPGPHRDDPADDA
jgi:hypothetical protein